MSETLNRGVGSKAGTSRGLRDPLTVVVGSGGVGKTTLAASLGVVAALEGERVLVMTFDPSLRLKDALGVGEEARESEVAVALPESAPGELDVSLLDARRTFDRLVERYAPDAESRRRILENRFYQHLSGSLSGILEYMAVERLFEVAAQERYDRVILDTPPTTQALDFLEAPQRITEFLDSRALKIAVREWFDSRGQLRAARRLGRLGRRMERFLDELIGLDFLRDVSEFFRAFGPLYDGFHSRAAEVQKLLRSPRTSFLLVAGPGEERVPDALFFARKLEESGHRLASVVVNRVHPRLDSSGGKGELPWGPGSGEGHELMRWLGQRDHQGVESLRALLSQHPLVALPMMADEPTHLGALEVLGRDLISELTQE
ncbi:MAG: ArsA-related P-loop ATPase [Acidobacteriota bacterium]